LFKHKSADTGNRFVFAIVTIQKYGTSGRTRSACESWGAKMLEIETPNASRRCGPV